MPMMGGLAACAATGAGMRKLRKGVIDLAAKEVPGAGRKKAAEELKRLNADIDLRFAGRTWQEII